MTMPDLRLLGAAVLLAALTAATLGAAPPTGEAFPTPTRQPVPATAPAPPPPPAPANPAPTPGGETLPGPRMRFAVLGSTHPGPYYAYAPVLPGVIQQIAAEQVDLVVGTGNYVEGATDGTVLQQQYQWLFWALQPLQAARALPVAFAPGEREILGSSLLGKLFAGQFGGLHYSFDRGAAHFIVLDTEVPGHEARIDGEQWWWLTQDLYQALGTRYLFVIMHRPLFPVASGRGRCLDRYPQYRDALHKLFADYHVSAVFAGAENLYHHEERDGVRYFITGGGGGPLDSSSPPALAAHHYLLVNCEETQFRVEVRQQP